ncbi:ParB family chromosome partitioning protein [Neomicrococcus aestuarii]|uniref:ParB family chromosome partitioning protein n=1 Tax=Neomicrococcus aestuarii TaxID=556325 RepID=A0A7W8TTU9_9MICC|nr:ParB family chromosome partitioning protein [Neomicrococcus aestuarii]
MPVADTAIGDKPLQTEAVDNGAKNDASGRLSEVASQADNLSEGTSSSSEVKASQETSSAGKTDSADAPAPRETPDPRKAPISGNQASTKKPNKVDSEGLESLDADASKPLSKSSGNATSDESPSASDAVEALRKRTSERRRKALEEVAAKSKAADDSTDEGSAEANDDDELPRMRPVDMFFGAPKKSPSKVSRETSRPTKKRAQVPDLLSSRAARVLKTQNQTEDSAEETPEADTSIDVPEDNVSRETQQKSTAEVSGDEAKAQVSKAHESKESKDLKEDGKSPSAGSDAVETPASVSESSASASSEPTSDDAPAEATPTSAEELKSIPGLSYAELPIHSIHPNRKQPRQVFDEDDMAELEHSIREIGLLQPIVVRPSGEPGDAPYELVMGERRWRAAQRVGFKTIPAIIRETKDEDLLRDALLENLHRSELNPLEEAAAYQQLLQEFGCSQDELSQKIGRSRSQISNTIRLMKLPALVQRRVAAGVISSGHARALLALEDPAEMERLAQRVVNEGLSVRSVEEIVALQAGLRRADNKKQQKDVARPERLDYFANALSDRLDTQVKITLGAKKGRVSIEFASVDDLNRIMGVIAPSS